MLDFTAAVDQARCALREAEETTGGIPASIFPDENKAPLFIAGMDSDLIRESIDQHIENCSDPHCEITHALIRPMIRIGIAEGIGAHSLVLERMYDTEGARAVAAGIWAACDILDEGATADAE